MTRILTTDILRSRVGRKTLSFCVTLLLARLMDRYCFAGWRLSSSVTLPARERENAAGSRAGRPPGA